MKDKNIYGKKWQRIRSMVLKRDGYMCRECRRYGKRVPAEHVHHVAHAEDDPTRIYDLDNLISLCAKCHNKAHPEKAIRAAKSKYN